MSADRLILWRHGRTVWNEEGRIQGHGGVGLDALGHEQARAAAVVLAAGGVARLWTSDLLRAEQTCGYLAEATGHEPVRDPRLREYHFGEWSGALHSEYAAAHPEEHRRFRRGEYEIAPGAESAREVRERTTAALSELVAETPRGTAVAVGHGGSIREAVAAMLGLPEPRAQDLAVLDNGGWAVLENHEFGWRLAAYNRVAAP